MKIYRIGRDYTNDIVIDDDSVSRVHAELREAADGNFHVVDLKSTYGTGILREGHWVQVHTAPVQPSDAIRFGDYETTVTQALRGVGAKTAPARPRRPRSDTQLHAPLSPRLKTYAVGGAVMLAAVAVAAAWLLSGTDTGKRFVAVCIERNMPAAACECSAAALNRTLTDAEFADLTEHFGDLTHPSLDLLPKLPTILQSMSNCGLKQL